jgi:hypothetical protein
MKLAVVIIAGLLTACGNAPPPVAAQLEKPNPLLMVPPPALPAVPAGANLFISNSQCSAEYVRETGKLVGLQKYARRITQK